MVDGARLSNGKFFPIKQTKADRIRAMTDEELAEWLAIQTADPYDPEYDKNGWLDWLKQEVE